MGLPTTEEYVAAAERALGRTLPAWLRARLMRENGGTVAAGGEYWELHCVLDTRDRRHATRSASHIVRETAVARGWEGFPADAVAIAHNGGGDRLVLLPDVDDEKAFDLLVYRWQHDSDDEPEPVQVEA